MGLSLFLILQFARFFSILGYQLPMNYLMYQKFQSVLTLNVLSHLSDFASMIHVVVLHQSYFMKKVSFNFYGQLDDPPPNNTTSEQQTCIHDLDSLQKFKIPHCLKLNKPIDIQLHSFCDTPEQGYADVVCLRIIEQNKITFFSLLTAKSKVAPSKTIALPCLELRGIHLFSKLMCYVLL